MWTASCYMNEIIALLRYARPSLNGQRSSVVTNNTLFRKLWRLSENNIVISAITARAFFHQEREAEYFPEAHLTHSRLTKPE